MRAAEGGGGEPAAEAPTATARVWVSDGPRYRFPERDPGSPRLPPTGICFSGGGTRSLAATAGQLRGLAETGLIADVGYLACVSGGAWAAVPYAYHAAGARDDAELLGAVRSPEAISLRSLATLPEARLDHPATAGFERHLAAAIADADLPRDQVWTRAVGATYLAPFGLFDPHAPAWFTSDAATAAAIMAANPHLTGTPFHAVHGGAWRPHPVINASLVWPRRPDGASDERQHVGFEFTPLGVGTPCRSTLRASGATCAVGGGYLEPFAFGCPAPASGPGASGRVRVVPPPRPFTLADATAATSASSTRAAALPFVPRAHHWPPGVEDGQPGRLHSFADGGDIENFGLIALLRRRIERIVVFVNTLHPLGEEVRPEAASGPAGIDTYIPPLFGYATAKCPHNQVFSRAAFGGVAEALCAAKRRGRAWSRRRGSRWSGTPGGELPAAGRRRSAGSTTSARLPGKRASTRRSDGPSRRGSRPTRRVRSPTSRSTGRKARTRAASSG